MTTDATKSLYSVTPTCAGRAGGFNDLTKTAISGFALSVRRSNTNLAPNDALVLFFSAGPSCPTSTISRYRASRACLRNFRALTAIAQQSLIQQVWQLLLPIFKCDLRSCSSIMSSTSLGRAANNSPCARRRYDLRSVGLCHGPPEPAPAGPHGQPAGEETGRPFTPIVGLLGQESMLVWLLLMDALRILLSTLSWAEDTKLQVVEVELLLDSRRGRLYPGGGIGDGLSVKAVGRWITGISSIERDPTGALTRCVLMPEDPFFSGGYMARGMTSSFDLGGRRKVLTVLGVLVGLSTDRVGGGDDVVGVRVGVGAGVGCGWEASPRLPPEEAEEVRERGEFELSGCGVSFSVLLLLLLPRVYHFWAPEGEAEKLWRY